MVVRKVTRQEALQMPFIADKDMIEALQPDAPAEALSIEVW